MELSVITITKNAGRRIEDVVANALAIGNESIVVDTGSTDDTPLRAERAGARVVRYNGPFDYSSPRNLGDEVAQGDWVLHLDDDEIIDPTQKPRIYARIRNNAFDNFMLLQLSYYGDNPPSQNYVARLFQRSTFKHRGRVHEWIYPQHETTFADVLIENRCPAGKRNDELWKFRRRLALQEMHELSAPIGCAEDDFAYVISRLRHLWTYTIDREKIGIIRQVGAMHEAAMQHDFSGHKERFQVGMLLAMCVDLCEAYEILEPDVSRVEDPNYLTLFALVAKNINPREAMVAIDRSIARDDNAYSHALKAAIHARLGDKRAYDRECTRAKELFPQDPLQDLLRTLLK